MKKLLIILLLSIFVNIHSHDTALFYASKTESELIKLQKRFDKAAIYRGYFYFEGVYYMELDSTDYEDYYKRLGIKIKCINKRFKRDIELYHTVSIDDTISVDTEIDLKYTL